MSQILEKVTRSVRENASSRNRASSRDLNDAIDLEFESGRGAFDLGEELELRRNAENRLFGLGKLQPLLDDPSIEEIWVNGNARVFVARSGVSSLTSVEFVDGELAGLVERMLRSTGRRIDRSSPFVDASLPDGSRLHVAIPDITRADWAVNIRKFPTSIITLEDLVIKGSLTAHQGQFLRHEIAIGTNVLVSGATQAGKTTVLSALLGCLSDSERLVTVEETFELRAVNKDWVAMQTRQPNLEGHGQVGLRRLIKEALRMRPSRLVVGEVREAEALDLLIALNSGLPGLCTIHANSATDALAKLCLLPLLAGQNISLEFIRPTVASCIGLVVHCELLKNGSRRVAEILRVKNVRGQLETELIS
jgi:pilus assembly protein CpaF